MSLLRTRVDGYLIKNKISMVETTGVRDPTLAQFDSVLVLLFEGRTPYSTSYFHSTSHYSSRRKNTSALRVTLREGRIFPLYESLFEKEEYSHSTSHYSSRGENTSTLRVITLRGENSLLYELLLFEKEEYFHSTSHYSPNRKISALRVTIPRLLLCGD